MKLHPQRPAFDRRDFITGRRTFLKSAVTAAATLSARATPSRPPNIIVIAADDLGYGDLSCYGSGIATPNIDRLAHEGIQFTDCNSASSVCTPARAGILTGRYPTRFGMPRVLDVNENHGIPDTETTLPQMLKPAGYSTMCVGKWHVGSVPQYFPTNRGFDEWYGIPYSIDQGNRPLMHNFDVIEAPASLDTLTRRYTQWAVDYINRSAKSPFFLYLAHAFPHLPLAASQPFLGKSFQGLYGDTVQEIDWSTGQILQALQSAGIDSDTLVMFTSDHGPWYQGSPGGLRGRKGDTFEGGFRVPFVARYPAFIPGGQVCRSLVSTLDILPTAGRLAGAALPPNPLDGIDLSPLLSGQQSELKREAFLYFNDVYLQAARMGNWKVHVTRFNSPAFTMPPAGGRLNLPLPWPEMYEMEADPDESRDRADRNPATVALVRTRMEQLLQSFPAEIQNAWSSTFGQKVQSTPSGCYPIPITS